MSEQNFALYVRNIHYDVGTQELGQAFEKFENLILAEIFTEKRGGQDFSKGTGKVVFSDSSSYERALREGGDIEVNGRKVIVAPLRQRGDRSFNKPSSQPVEEKKTESRPEPKKEETHFEHSTKQQTGLKDVSKSIHVRNIPYSATSDDIKQAFTQFGNVKFVKIPREKQRGTLVSKGFCFIDFEDEESYNKALIGDVKIKDRTLKILKSLPPKLKTTGYIGKIHPDATPETLKQSYQNVKDAKIIKTQNGNTFALVDFNTPQDLTSVLGSITTILDQKTFIKVSRSPFDGKRRPFGNNGGFRNNGRFRNNRRFSNNRYGTQKGE